MLDGILHLYHCWTSWTKRCEREKFSKRLNGSVSQILYVNDSGYWGLKFNRLVDMFLPDIRRQIYLVYQSLRSINQAAEPKNMLLVSRGITLDSKESRYIDKTILDYYRQGIDDIYLVLPLLEKINSES
jgi:hypothetical protein